MIRPMLKKVFPQVLAWTAVIALSALMATAQDSSPATAPAAGQRSDGQIEMDVVHALDASRALNKDLITAATIQSEVTLSGTVSSDASKELAESIASRVQGVTALHNNLQVGNPQAAQNSPAGDASEQQMAADAQPDSAANSAGQGAPGQTDGPLPVPNQAQAPDQSQEPVAPPARPQFRRVQPPMTAYKTPTGPVTIGTGTLLQLRTSEPVGTKKAKDGTPVQFMVIQDIAVGGVLAIPRGATVHGVVTESKKAGDLGGSAVLALQLTSLDLGGQSYPLTSDQFKVKGPNKAGQTVGSALTGGILGTIIGCAADRGFGCAVGAGAGVAAGTAASAASPGPGVWIPAEAKVDFHLAAPITVTPVDSQEAARLAEGLYPGGPTLYQRRYAPYGYPYGVPYYGGYPPVFFRPYYAVGGYYYWR
jgi:hypothetical protein